MNPWMLRVRNEGRDVENEGPEFGAALLSLPWGPLYNPTGPYLRLRLMGYIPIIVVAISVQVLGKYMIIRYLDP